MIKRIIFFAITLTVQSFTYAQNYQKVTTENTNSSNRLGSNVAIEDSLAVAISELNTSSNGNAGAYFYKKTNGTWAKEQFIEHIGPNYGISENSIFSGSAIDIEGTKSFIASYEASGGNVYIYEYNGTNWALNQTLTSTTPFFGSSLSVDNNTLVVTSRLDSYIYNYNGTNWILSDTITALDNPFSSNCFVDGASILIGHAQDNEYVTNGGAVYAYDYTNNILSTPQKLNLSHLPAGSYFGNTIAVKEDKMIIGASRYSYNNFSNSGKAFIYEKTGNNWVLTDSLQPSIVDSDNTYFGKSLAIIHDKFIVGESRYSSNSGRIYVYEKTGNNWIETANITPQEVEIYDWFSNKMAYDDKQLIVAAFGDDDSALDGGAAYILDFCSAITSSVTHNICKNDSILLFGSYYDTDTTLNTTLVNIYGCDSIVQTTIITDDCSNTIENNLESINIFPNPTKDNITILGKLANMNLKLTNLTGKTQRIDFIQKNKNSTIISFKDLPSGIYFLTLSSDKNVITKKIIKQ